MKQIRIYLIAYIVLSFINQIHAQQQANQENQNERRKITPIQLYMQEIEMKTDSGSIHKFGISKDEITVDQYLYFINEADVDSTGNHWGVNYIDIQDEDCPIAYRDGYFYFKPTKFTSNVWCPITEVSWYGAYAFCEYLSETFSDNFRLPTEVEWEYACRAGTTTDFYTGDCLSSSDANIDGIHARNGCPPSSWAKNLTAIGSYKSNEWDLWDMHGNAAEWCLDTYVYEEDETSNSYNLRYNDENEKVIKGGCFFWDANSAKSSSRFHENPSETKDFIGFRVVSIGN